MECLEEQIVHNLSKTNILEKHSSESIILNGSKGIHPLKFLFD